MLIMWQRMWAVDHVEPICKIALLPVLLSQAAPAGRVARRSRRSSVRAQWDSGLHLRPRWRIYWRKQERGGSLGDGQEDPAGCREGPCKRKQQLKIRRGQKIAFCYEVGSTHHQSWAQPWYTPFCSSRVRAAWNGSQLWLTVFQSRWSVVFLPVVL